MFTEPVDVCGSVLQKRDAIKKLLLAIMTTHGRGDRADSCGTVHIHDPPPSLHLNTHFRKNKKQKQKNRFAWLTTLTNRSATAAQRNGSVTTADP